MEMPTPGGLFAGRFGAFGLSRVLPADADAPITHGHAAARIANMNPSCPVSVASISIASISVVGGIRVAVMAIAGVAVGGVSVAGIAVGGVSVAGIPVSA